MSVAGLEIRKGGARLRLSRSYPQALLCSTGCRVALAPPERSDPLWSGGNHRDRTPNVTGAAAANIVCTAAAFPACINNSHVFLKPKRGSRRRSIADAVAADINIFGWGARSAADGRNPEPGCMKKRTRGRSLHANIVGCWCCLNRLRDGPGSHHAICGNIPFGGNATAMAGPRSGDCYSEPR